MTKLTDAIRKDERNKTLDQVKSKLESLRVGKLLIQCSCHRSEEIWTYRLSDLQRIFEISKLRGAKE